MQKSYSIIDLSRQSYASEADDLTPDDLKDLIELEREINANGEKYLVFPRGLLERIINHIEGYGLEPEILTPEVTEYLESHLRGFGEPAEAYITENRVNDQVVLDSRYPKLASAPNIVLEMTHIIDVLAELAHDNEKLAAEIDDLEKSNETLAEEKDLLTKKLDTQATEFEFLLKKRDDEIATLKAKIVELEAVSGPEAVKFVELGKKATKVSGMDRVV